MGPPAGTGAVGFMLPGRRRDLDLAGRAVGQVVELDDLAVAALVDEPLDQAPVQAAHEVGVGLGQLAERAAGEGDGGAVVVDDGLGVEPERRQLGGEGLGTGAGAAVGPPRPPPARGPPRRRRPPDRSALAARRSSMRASTGKAGGSNPSAGASAASE